MVELCPRRAYGGPGILESDPTRRTGELVGVAVPVVIGVALIVLAPAKQSVERVWAAIV